MLTRLESAPVDEACLRKTRIGHVINQLRSDAKGIKTNPVFTLPYSF